MATVRGTSNHTYSIEDSLGQGATCNVFKGLSKKGEFHALKIFETHAYRDIDREVTALQKLKHENIIHFIGVEAELMSRRTVVVMEFCEGGSLASFLLEPCNFYGLPESEFLLFLKHLVSGMEHLRIHGFIHRDIKPGNILRCIGNDGKSIFKLSDFGTARPLADDEFFKSLVGTEEYLHPDLFNAAFMNQGKSLNFPHSVDLWSVGATVYNAATGTVPFLPYHRRQDRKTMYEMIDKKPPGVIGARQHSQNGEIQWMYDLPDTCQLSGGLQKLLIPLLVSLFERDPGRTWSFEEFFTATKDILQCEAITFLAILPHPSPFDCIYYPHFSTVVQFTKQLSEVEGIRMNVSMGLQEVLYGETSLADWLKDDDQVFDMPPTDLTSPIIPLPAHLPECEGNFSIPEPAMSKIVSEELSFSGGFLGKEVQTARSMCAIIALIDRRTSAIANFQHHLSHLTHRLRCELRHKKDEVEGVFRLMTDIFDVINGTANMMTWSVKEKSDFEQVKKLLKSIEEVLQAAAITLSLSVEQQQWNFNGQNCMQQTRRALEEAESWLEEILRITKTVEKTKLTTQHSENTMIAIKQHLQAVYKRAVRLWSDQCFQKTTFLRQSFLDWYRSFLPTSRGIQKCREDLVQVVSLVAQLFKSVVNRSQGHEDEMLTKRISKSLLSVTNTKIERSKLNDLMVNLKDLTENLEAPEVFNTPLELHDGSSL